MQPLQNPPLCISATSTECILSKLNGEKRNGKFVSTEQIEGSLDLGGREGRERRERRGERW